jgi:hypothetical protein
LDTTNPEVLKKIIGQRLTSDMMDSLDILFPERTPDLTDSVDQIRYASGQRSVIRFLKGLTHG